MTDVTTRVPVAVRFFAAASAAAGSDTGVLNLESGSTVADAIGELCGQSDAMALLLQKCTFLCDGVAVRDRDSVLRPHQTLDVLPPFAGG
jgi:molybdopterin converting factor small subunit